MPARVRRQGDGSAPGQAAWCQAAEGGRKSLVGYGAGSTSVLAGTSHAETKSAGGLPDTNQLGSNWHDEPPLLPQTMISVPSLPTFHGEQFFVIKKEASKPLLLLLQLSQFKPKTPWDRAC